MVCKVLGREGETGAQEVLRTSCYIAGSSGIVTLGCILAGGRACVSSLRALHGSTEMGVDDVISIANMCEDRSHKHVRAAHTPHTAQQENTAITLNSYKPLRRGVTGSQPKKAALININMNRCQWKFAKLKFEWGVIPLFFNHWMLFSLNWWGVILPHMKSIL